MDLKILEFSEVLSSLKYYGLYLRVLSPPQPAVRLICKLHSRLAWILERKRRIKDKCRHVCVQSHLKTLSI